MSCLYSDITEKHRADVAGERRSLEAGDPTELPASAEGLLLIASMSPRGHVTIAGDSTGNGLQAHAEETTPRMTGSAGNRRPLEPRKEIFAVPGLESFQPGRLFACCFCNQNSRKNFPCCTIHENREYFPRSRGRLLLPRVTWTNNLI
ncbi:uncharacterized protein LOC144753169 isoform X1 [Lissotriton helveticus]